MNASSMTFDRLRRNIPQLKELKSAAVKKRKKIIAAANSDLIKCVCDCCANVVKGNLHINKVHRKKLARHAGTIRELSRKKQSVAKRRALLSQKGGFLPVLLAPVLSLIASQLFKR